MSEVFNGDFDKVLEAANKIWQAHKKNKGDSWKNVSFDVIVNGVKEEYHEWRTEYRNTLKAILESKFDEEATSEDGQYLELLDLLNMTLIAAEKLRLRQQPQVHVGDGDKDD
ncbi:hypothetical protein CMI37_35520 [Candidatus Pacearchaeota archaeon]|nr:hypothetical protein [Candidatus Pacearchaeota archaeon]|tara:strand:+ start:3441 stop:3776 length:336 start_codon:yes stop_codon:yes gene_type:complete